MALVVLQNVPLAPLTTFKVGGPARFFVEALSESDVINAVSFAREGQHPLFVLGGGSNLLVSDEGFLGLVVRISLRGSEQGLGEKPTSGKRLFRVAAGEDWDTFVAFAVSQDCAGIETLSGIPGTVGGTPVQNVGAYGQEVADTIVSVRALDLETLQIVELDHEACGFAYRTSIFNSSHRGRYIVLKVAYTLTPGGAPRIEYADLKRHFADCRHPTLAQVREAVRGIRHSKGMLIVEGEDDCRSAGSFFKNPIVPNAHYEVIAATAARAGASAAPPRYPAACGHVKLSAAWLIEHAGFPKGYGNGSAGISRRHTLAMVNRGGARASDIIALKDEIQRGVRHTFGVELVPEPVFVGFEHLDAQSSGPSHSTPKPSMPVGSELTDPQNS